MRSLFLSAIIASFVNASTALAIEQCRFIEKKPDRETCYVRQAEALAAKKKAAAAIQASPTSPLRMESDITAGRVPSICRGC